MVALAGQALSIGEAGHVLGARLNVEVKRRHRLHALAPILPAPTRNASRRDLASAGTLPNAARGDRWRRHAVGFLQGLRAPVEGFSFLVRRPKLWPYAIVPILINLVVTVLLFVGLNRGGVSWAGVLTGFTA